MAACWQCPHLYQAVDVKMYIDKYLKLKSGVEYGRV